jgi:cell division protease FtsH
VATHEQQTERQVENRTDRQADDPPLFRQPAFGWNILATILIIGLAIAVTLTTQRKSPPVVALPYSEFLQALEAGRIVNVTLSDQTLTGDMRAPATTTATAPDQSAPITRFTSVAFDDPGLVQKLHDKHVQFEREVSSGSLLSIFSWVLPLLLFYGLWSFILRRAGKAQAGLLTMTKSKARVYMEKGIKTTFADVAGVDEAKEELKEVVNFLKEPQRYSRLGGRMPKGVLLVGPPGTGKTLLARAIAGEANVPFFSINGSEFVEMYVGLGAARVRDLFQDTKRSAPCILFIDEIDALGKSRALGAGGLSANDEKEQTLNQLLAEMDGFDPREGVILLAATNRPEILDPALLRAGRFDRQVLVSLPDQAGRGQILRVHLKRIKMAAAVDVTKIAALTAGFSGADLANLANEAALVATRRDGDDVTEDDFTRAIERIVAGLEQKSKIMNPAEKRRVAFHEMGHATVALALGTSEKVHKVSIIPHGIGALGYTLRRPTEDRYLHVKSELTAKIAVLLGGRAAEEDALGEVSTGAADDLAKATALARAMIVNLGMSEKMGLAVCEERPAQLLSPTTLGLNGGTISNATAQLIDEEIHRILDEGYTLATKVIRENSKFLHAGADRLLAIETLDETELKQLSAAYKLPLLNIDEGV